MDAAGWCFNALFPDARLGIVVLGISGSFAANGDASR